MVVRGVHLRRRPLVAVPPQFSLEIVLLSLACSLGGLLLSNEFLELAARGVCKTIPHSQKTKSVLTSLHPEGKKKKKTQKKTCALLSFPPAAWKPGSGMQSPAGTSDQRAMNASQGDTPERSESAGTCGKKVESVVLVVFLCFSPPGPPCLLPLCPLPLSPVPLLALFPLPLCPSLLLDLHRRLRGGGFGLLLLV